MIVFNLKIIISLAKAVYFAVYKSLGTGFGWLQLYFTAV